MKTVNVITEDKLLEYTGSLTRLKDKIITRGIKQRLILGNKFTLGYLNVINKIDNVLSNEDNFLTCEYCQKDFNKDNIIVIDEDNLCEDCIDNNFYICEDCGKYIDNTNIYSFNDSGYCKKCYFIQKQEAYFNHVLKNKKLKALKRYCQKNKSYDITQAYFKIDKYEWSIENHSKAYRLGSWSANSWFDIGDNIQYLLEAIEFNLGYNIDKLTDISLT